jgi:peptidoglycan/xylan/chitin deacetylase (PgdA/CDA1 family)
LTAAGRLVKRLLSNPLAWQAARPLVGRGCMVLTYHRVCPPDSRFPGLPVETFRAHMEWLASNCRPIRASELVASLEAEGPLPVLVTFDDAYKDYLEHAYPILQRYAVPAVNFAPTHFIDTGEAPWWDVVHAVAHASRRDVLTLPWDPHTTYDMKNGGRILAIAACKQRIKAMLEPRATTLAQIVRSFDVDESALAIERQFMTWDDLRTVSDLTEIGAHSHTHSLMKHLDIPALAHEVATSRDRIAAETGQRPLTFAYPSGSFSEAAKQAVRDHGFTLAFSTIAGRNRADSDRYELRRVNGPRTLEELVWRLARA